MSTHSAERRAAVKAGCKPVHFSLDGCPLSCYFFGNVATLRDTLSTSRSVGRGTGAFIYALSADKTSPALAASRHAITALFSCRFKCPCPPRRQRHFRSNADRAYNTLHFASKVVCQRALFSPVGSVKRFKMQRILRLPLATRAPLDSPFTLSYGRCDFIVVAIRFIPVSSRFAECPCNPKGAVL